MSREQFEKWAKDNDFSVQTHPKIGYLRLSTGSAWKVWQARQPEIDALTAEVEKLRKDAERYRTIPSLDWYVGPLYGTYNDLVVDGEYLNHSTSKEALDAAIDTAMKETK